MHERRSGEDAQLTLAGIESHSHPGVGVRQRTRSVRRRGGGYLHECTSSELWERARLRELEAMGLPTFWIDVAREIGFADFMAMWRILDRTVHLRSEAESMIEVQLRRLTSYHRFQRNRFIESLVNAGLPDKAIRARVKSELGEDLSLSHISRLAGRRRVRAA